MARAPRRIKRAARKAGLRELGGLNGRAYDRAMRPVVLACLIAFLTAACASPGAPPPAPDDCVRIEVWSNGWHTNLVFFAADLADDHPLRRSFPEARRFLVGWGERDYYREENPGVLTGLRAVLLPTRSVVQVIAAGGEHELGYLWTPSESAMLALSRAGMDRLAAGIADTLVLDGAGLPVVAPADRGPKVGVFLEARPGFHLFRMCNHWTAARLSDAGARVEPRWAFHAPWLIGALERNTPAACPVAD